jgi:hypothetical protein
MNDPGTHKKNAHYHPVVPSSQGRKDNPLPPSAREVWPSPTLAAYAVAEPMAEDNKGAESEESPGDGSENSV